MQTARPHPSETNGPLPTGAEIRWVAGLEAGRRVLDLAASEDLSERTMYRKLAELKVRYTARTTAELVAIFERNEWC